MRTVTENTLVATLLPLRMVAVNWTVIGLSKCDIARILIPPTVAEPNLTVEPAGYR